MTLESKFRYIILALTTCVAFVWFLMVVEVVLEAANHAAKTLPVSIASSVGEGSLEILDRVLFEPSELSDSDKQRIASQFDEMLKHVDSEFSYQQMFRSLGNMGSNAFALPDGTIIMSDEMVNLSENDQQLMSVFAHEIGHVEHRHGLRHAMQSSGLAILLVVITGDVISASNMIAAIPAFLLENQYSREMETESDTYALEYMRRHQMDSAHFARITTLLQGWDTLQRDDESDSDILNFLSTHPAIEERIARFSQ